MELTDLLPEVEAYTRDELLPALAHGMGLTDAKKMEVAKIAASLFRPQYR